MLYKFPMPTRHSGVKLYALPNQQLGIEVGRPRDATMAYDAEIATGRTVTIRRPDFDRVITDALRRVDAEDAAMPKAGKPPVRSKDMKTDTLEYDDDATEVISNLLDYLGKYLDPEQMEAVNLIISSGTGPEESGEPNNSTATDRRRGRQAADQARRRPMSSATEDKYEAMFPHANRLA